MGWGINKQQRNAVLSGWMASPDTLHACTVVDMCSEARRVGSSTYEQSAVCLSRRICEALWRRTSTGGMLVMLFDNSEFTHSERRLFYQQRYKPPSAAKVEEAGRDVSKVVVGGFVHKIGSEPYTNAEIAEFTKFSKVNFNRLWASSHGKAAAWRMLADGCVHWHCSRGVPGEHRLVCWYKGDPRVWPMGDTALRAAASEMCNNTFGEADQRVCEAAAVAARTMSVRIQTIDTDMVLQCLCTKTFGVNDMCLQLKNECVDVRKMRSGLGPRLAGKLKSTRKRQPLVSCAFWLMACGGVDYCKGLTRFGYTTACLLKNMQRDECGVAEHTPGGGVAINTGALMAALARTKRRNMKAARWEDLITEVNKMAFCVALFAGVGKLKAGCGGPSVPCAPWTRNTGCLTDSSIRASAGSAAPVVLEDQ